MVAPEEPPASEAPRTSYALPLFKRTMVAVAPLLLAIFFVLASASAATVAQVSVGNHIPSVLGLPVLNCNGDAPGFCPHNPFV